MSLRKIFKKIKLYRLHNYLGRKLIKYSRDPRPSSYPYISGDGFRKIADHIYDETKKVCPIEVKEGDIIFVKSDFLNDYFKNCHPQIKNRYKIISHNSDYNITESDLKYIDDKIIYWFAQNVTIKNYKIIPIPFGLDNLHYHQITPKIIEAIKDKKKENRIIFGFNIKTNSEERQPAYDYLISSQIADQPKWESHPKKYLEMISTYKFIACPSGNGLDDPRFWQSSYLKMIPITTKSAARDYFKEIGVPILLVEKWTNLDHYSEEDLSNVYNELTAQAKPEILFMDYWIDLIKNKI